MNKKIVVCFLNHSLVDIAKQLLLSAPTYITSEIELPTIDTLRTACTVFFEQSSPPGSSCFLQARFLAKVISNYEQIRRINSNDHGSHESQQETVPTVTDPIPMITRGSNGFHTTTTYRPDTSQRIQMTAFHQQHEPEYVVSHRLHNENNGPADNSTPLGLSLAEDFHLGFTDNETWAEVFNDAGFCIQDGIFFS
jgi:hypothetical protein